MVYIPDDCDIDHSVRLNVRRTHTHTHLNI